MITHRGHQSNPNLESKPDLALAESIVTQVNTICCFGSTNRNSVENAKRLLSALMEKMQSLFLAQRGSDLHTSLLKMMEGNSRFKAFFRKTKRQYAKQIEDCRQQSLTGETDRYIMPLTDLCRIELKILVEILRLLPLSDDIKLKCQNLNVNDFNTAFTDYLRTVNNSKALTKSKRLGHTVSKSEFTEELTYQLKFNPGDKAESKYDKLLYFKRMAKDTQDTAIPYGFGNCALMADIAFLLALTKFDDKVTYIRFVDQSGKTEETNMVAIGDWPKPGCIIIDPWTGIQGQTFIWQGKIEKTPEVTSSYNQIKILLEIDKDEQLRHVMLLQLKRLNLFSNLDNDHTRCENFAKVISLSQKFMRVYATIMPTNDDSSNLWITSEGYESNALPNPFGN